MVLFMGYTSYFTSTEASEHACCSLAMVAGDIIFDSSVVNTVPQEKFLRNSHNKSNLIDCVVTAVQKSA